MGISGLDRFLASAITTSNKASSGLNSTNPGNEKSLWSLFIRAIEAIPRGLVNLRNYLCSCLDDDTTVSSRVNISRDRIFKNVASSLNVTPNVTPPDSDNEFGDIEDPNIYIKDHLFKIAPYINAPLTDRMAQIEILANLTKGKQLDSRLQKIVDEVLESNHLTNLFAEEFITKVNEFSQAYKAEKSPPFIEKMN